MRDDQIDLCGLTGRVNVIKQDHRVGLIKKGGTTTIWVRPDLIRVVEAIDSGAQSIVGGTREAIFVQYAKFYLLNVGQLARSVRYDSVLLPNSFDLRPRSVSFISTKLCNFSCVHCYNNSGRPDQTELNGEEKVSLISYLGRWGVPILVLSGGEPTYDPDLARMIREAKKFRMGIKITTNGWQIPDCLIEGIADRVIFQVNVSLDGATPEIHDTFRRKRGSFVRVLASLQSLKQVGIPNLVVNSCVHSGRIDHMEPITKLAIEHKCCAVSFKAVLSTGRKDSQCETPFVLTPQQLIDFEKERNRLRLKYSSHIEIDGKLITDEVPRDLRELVYCNAGSSSMMIDANGKMLPCEILDWIRFAPDVRQQAPSQAWMEDPVFARFRSFKEQAGPGGCGTSGCPGCAMKQQALADEHAGNRVY